MMRSLNPNPSTNLDVMVNKQCTKESLIILLLNYNLDVMINNREKKYWQSDVVGVLDGTCWYL